MPILFEALTSAKGEEEKEEELVDISKRKFGHDLGGYCLGMVLNNTLLREEMYLKIHAKWLSDIDSAQCVL